MVRTTRSPVLRYVVHGWLLLEMLMLIRSVGDESVFADLELSKKEFVGIQTTWGIGS